MPAQTVMFLTQTYSKEKQEEKNTFYLTPEQYKQQKTSIARRGAAVFELR